VKTLLSADAAVEVILDSGTLHAGLLTWADETGAGVAVALPRSVALDVVGYASALVLMARGSPQGPVVGGRDFSDASLLACTLPLPKRAGVLGTRRPA
jgi:hypothetical protein